MKKLLILLFYFIFISNNFSQTIITDEIKLIISSPDRTEINSGRNYIFNSNNISFGNTDIELILYYFDKEIRKIDENIDELGIGFLERSFLDLSNEFCGLGRTFSLSAINLNPLELNQVDFIKAVEEAFLNELEIQMKEISIPKYIYEYDYSQIKSNALLKNENENEKFCQCVSSNSNTIKLRNADSHCLISKIAETFQLFIVASKSAANSSTFDNKVYDYDIPIRYNDFATVESEIKNDHGIILTKTDEWIRAKIYKTRN